jgi:hypothetical protein
LVVFTVLARALSSCGKSTFAQVGISQATVNTVVM